MRFRRDLAAQTIVAVAAALRANWPALSPSQQEAVREIIRARGPEIYDTDALNRAGPMIELLEEIASLSPLPGPVLDALKAGEGDSSSFERINEAKRDQALAALQSVYDARTYASPADLADALRLRIAQVYHTLDSATRSRWEALDRAYAGGGSPIEYLDAVDALLGERLPFVREAINAGKTWSAIRYRSAAKPKGARDESPLESFPPTYGIAPPGRDVTPAQEAPVRVRRFANVYFPAQVHAAQQSVPLIVHIAQQAAAGTVTVREGSSEIVLTVGDLQIFVHAEDFDVQYGLGGAELPAVPFGATVTVRPAANSEPVIFFLTPAAPGAKRISVEFYQARKCIGSLAFGVEVVTAFRAPAVGRAEITPVALAAASGQSAPPELALRVIALGDGLSYEYVLTSADGRYDQRKLGRVTLKSDPAAFFKTITDELSSRARINSDEREPGDEETACSRLEEIGRRLWADLLPAEFRAEYRAGNLNAYKGKGFVITSDEPWIPWEMVRPFEREGGRAVVNDAPLCELFRLSRWLSGSGAPGALTVKRGVVVAPRDNLQSVQAEIDYFKQVSTRGGHWSVPVLTAADVRREMEEGAAHVFHFSCHGNFQADDADESRLKLEDGFLMPSNIRFDDKLALWQSAPLIFLNACHAGRVGISVTRLGGWAEAFLAVGATAFIGSLWAINDRLAARFAREFYDRLWGWSGGAPQTVGEAFYGARMAIKAEDEANPTWLAYVLYGDPNGRIVFGG